MIELPSKKQIWQFNEMSSLIKTFYNNYLCHENGIRATEEFHKNAFDEEDEEVQKK